MVVINSHIHRPWQRGHRHIVSPLRKISSWLQHSDSYTPDFFASSEVFINAPFNPQTIVHERFHQVGIDKSGVWRPRAHDELLTSGQVAESLQALFVIDARHVANTFRKIMRAFARNCQTAFCRTVREARVRYGAVSLNDRPIFHRSRPKCIQARASLGSDVDFDGFVATAARRAGCKTHDVSTIPRIMSGTAAPAVSPEIACDIAAPLRTKNSPA
jgi:hypothetical protein